MRNDPTNAEFVALWDALVDCYGLGDRLQNQDFCNTVIDGMFETIEKYVIRPIPLAGGWQSKYRGIAAVAVCC
jgi:hypothetical protein